MSTLADFKYKRKYKAPKGSDGSGSRRNGKKAQDLIIKVPRGTVIREAQSGAVMSDMSSDEPFVAAKGGKGGWGNCHFATPTRQTPRFAKAGQPGEEWDITLELKLLADVGLLGFPNVGKSSFISVVSEAKPIVADYHFTTITPVLGVVSRGEGNSFVIADIPGLIEGASEGVGLGHEFLRHVERCRMLLHIVDVSGSEGRDPIEDFEKINLELERFNPALSKCPQIVAGNKIDLASEEQLERFRTYMKEKGYEYFEMCAPILEGTREVINAVSAKLATLEPVKHFESEEIPLEVLMQKQNTGFSITVQEGIYFVDAPWIVRVMNSVNMDDYESLQYLQRVLITSGIIDALRNEGIEEGDTVDIYGFQFDFVN